MPIPLAMPSASAAHLAVERLAHADHLTQQEKIHEISRQFESILLRQFLNEAQKPMFGTESEMSGGQKAVYQDMVVNVLSDSISQSGRFGLAQVFERELMPRNLAQATAAQGGKEAEAKQDHE
ncbi:MAG: rod-binding protein [Verrucomicrobiota bacterium]|nr:rod-binding protein [Verrucomicrobiota bacterium]